VVVENQHLMMMMMMMTGQSWLKMIMLLWGRLCVKQCSLLYFLYIMGGGGKGRTKGIDSAAAVGRHDEKIPSRPTGGKSRTP